VTCHGSSDLLLHLIQVDRGSLCLFRLAKTRDIGVPCIHPIPTRLPFEVSLKRTQLTEPLRPGILRPIGEKATDYLCVLMPMQVV